MLGLGLSVCRRSGCRSCWLPLGAGHYGIRFYPKLSQVRVKEVVDEHAESFAKLLGVPLECAERILEKAPSAAKIKPKSLQKIPKVLEKYEFPPMTYVASPSLFTVSPSFLENQILVFKETGINYKDPYLLKRFRNIVRMWLSTLRGMHILPMNEDVVENYLKALRVSEEQVPFVRGFVPEDVANKHIRELRAAFLVPYIALLLNCEPAASEKIIKRYPRVVFRSFSWIREAVQILKEDYELTNELIRRHGYLLLMSPDHLRHLHSSVKTLADVPLVKLIKGRPKILTQSAETLLQMESDFRKHGIPIESVAKNAEVFTLSEETIRHRLEELERIPELQVLKSNPRVIRLIYYQTKAKKRLEELNEQQLSLNTLAVNMKRYERFYERKARWRGLDIYNFLQSRVPAKSQAALRQKLQVNSNYLSCPIVNMKEVLDYLQIEEKVDNSIIFEALPIVLYPVEKIKLAFEETINSGEAKITDSHFLQMVLYMMEKTYHFSGDGIWHADVMSIPDFDLDVDDIDPIEEVDADVELDPDDLDGVTDEGSDDDELI